MDTTKREAPDRDSLRLRKAMADVVTASSHLADKVAIAQQQLEAWAKNHSQKDLAAKAGVSAPYLSDLVHRNRALTYESALKILKALGGE